MVRYTCGLEAVIRTSWTNRNPGRRFYGCPTLSLTCVNFLRWYDPPMCQRSVQIILGLLRSRNELEEIVAMIEEKRHKLLKFLIISWVEKFLQRVKIYRRAIIEELERLPGNLVACKTREHLKRILKAVFVETCYKITALSILTEEPVGVMSKLEINNLTRQLLDIIDERCSFIGELEQRLLTNIMVYKTRQELKGLQKDDMIRANGR
ncbi:zinc finger, GRF-type containing protein [Tanacetum coccineum]|uniref:Zinc finger, GRF-type containing protein n=1 Tax=Tanacetum coccineum TaxID=301880 RepID=A0ABQ5ANU8_9ASTR